MCNPARRKPPEWRALAEECACVACEHAHQGANALKCDGLVREERRTAVPRASRPCGSEAPAGERDAGRQGSRTTSIPACSDLVAFEPGVQLEPGEAEEGGGADLWRARAGGHPHGLPLHGIQQLGAAGGRSGAAAAWGRAGGSARWAP